MSKMKNRDIDKNVSYFVRNIESSGIKCKHRFHETRSKDKPGQHTVHNRCSIMSSGKCLYKNCSHDTCNLAKGK